MKIYQGVRFESELTFVKKESPRILKDGVLIEISDEM